MTDFRALVSLLVNSAVEFIIIGGTAATVHGSARLTEDLDIVYRRTDGNLSRLVRSLTPYKPYLRGAPAGLPFSWDERVSAGAKCQSDDLQVHGRRDGARLLR